MSTPRGVRRVLLLCATVVAAALAGPVALASASYSSTVLADTPQGYWPLDDAASTSAADASGHGNTLTGTGTSVTAGLTDGPFAGAGGMRFDGGSLGRTYFTATNNFAFEYWARSDRVNETEAVVANGLIESNCTHGILGAAIGSDAYSYSSDTCNQGAPTTHTPIFTSTSAWHHFVVQRAAGVTTLYADGVAVPGATSHTITINSGSFRVGAMQGGSLPNTHGPFKGSISEVAYYNHTLTAGQIAEHFNIAVGAPVNSTAPSITPATLLGPGVTLTADPGTWAAAAPAFTYQWRRCDAAGNSCADIGGATASTYALTDTDAGATLRVRVTATTAHGNGSATAAATARVSVQTPRGQAGYGQAVRDDAPLGFWPLDDAVSTLAADASGHDNPLTGPGTNVTAGLTDGPIAGAGAMRFNGGYVSRAYFPATNNFAMELWARSDRVNEAEALVANGWVESSCTHGILAAAVAGDTYAYDSDTCSQGAGTAHQATFSGTTDWHHLVVQRAAGVTTLYVDGVAKATDSHTITINNGSFRVGAMQGGALPNTHGPFKGSLADVAYYDHTLTTTQIAQHFAAGQGPPTADTRPVVSPSAVVYETDDLTATAGTWSGAGVLTPSYQWEACTPSGGCGAITGATGTTYHLTAGEIGKTVRVVVTETSDQWGASTPIASAQTQTVREATPANTAPPTISGTAMHLRTLTSATGTWTGKPTIAFTRQWRRCDASGGACTDIAGATGTSYALTTADIGSRIRVVVTGTNATAAVAATSAPTAAVAPAPPANATAPAVSGTAIDGGTLTATTGTWTGTAPITYASQWRRCNAGGTGCADVDGATSTTYTLGPDDIGHTLRVAVTATNVADSTTATSAASAVVTGIAPSNTAAPEVTGEAQDGETLSATAGSWSGSIPITYAYQWRRCDATGAGCADVDGATDDTYALHAADIGSTVRVVVTATNVAGDASRASEPTGVVAGVAPVNTAAPEVAGDAQDGAMLIDLSSGAWTGSTPITYSRQWQRCDLAVDDCGDIDGATNTTYTLTADDIGWRVRVAVTATNVAGDASETTGVVTGLPPVNVAAPEISGDAIEIGHFTASTGTWTGSAPITYTYQWRRCDAEGDGCADIDGATAAGLDLGPDDTGHTLRVVVTASNGSGQDDATSAASDVVGPLGRAAL